MMNPEQWAKVRAWCSNPSLVLLAASGNLRGQLGGHPSEMRAFLCALGSDCSSEKSSAAQVFFSLATDALGDSPMSQHAVLLRPQLRNPADSDWVSPR